MNSSKKSKQLFEKYGLKGWGVFFLSGIILFVFHITGLAQLLRRDGEFIGLVLEVFLLVILVFLFPKLFNYFSKLYNSILNNRG
ncbi:MAG: hypothetical protein HON14_02040 [Rhodospirillaceae bacterium]|jgi:hypothetical protein|nr:hypothetical protein [Rhodospirillaceae bacterium]MBT4937883.1 hypothetical protein [Rhodospirillaceae bacterium]